MSKILVSACLMGDRVRYDGGHNKQDNDFLSQWQQQGRVVTVCPEVAGGLAVPRTPSEIQGGDGHAVLEGNSTVINLDGIDVTEQYRAGAEQALSLVRRHHLRIAILKENSPSCGSSFTYDGSFQRVLNSGMGVTAALLTRHGVKVFSEQELQQAADYLHQITT